jgi:hypothetical protein
MKHVLSLSIFLFFSPILCSGQTQVLQPHEETLEYFFPIDASHKRIVIVNNAHQFLHNLEYFLHENTKQLLKESQRHTYGFCYTGIVDNSNGPHLALINHQYPYFLNLQIYKLVTYFNGQTTSILIQQSKNIDPTFCPNVTKKQSFLYNQEFFWQTSKYRHEKINDDIKYSFSSFWGPFFMHNDQASCFFIQIYLVIMRYIKMMKMFI